MRRNDGGSEIIKSILQKILYFLAKMTVKKYEPLVIGVTGSVGKTSTKEAIFTVLKHKYWVRKSEKSFNTEIGMPLAILGMENHHKNIFAWTRDLTTSFLKIIFMAKYPEILILEFGVQKPKDMDYLLGIAKPFIGVVTAIGEIPVHVEFFVGTREVAEEKSKLIQSLSNKGFAILNYDDEAVYEMKRKSKAHMMTFGFHEHSDLKIINYDLHINPNGKPEGLAIKVEYNGSIVPIRLNNCFGKPQAYSAAAACLVGLAMNMNLVEIAEALKEFEPPAGRLRLMRGIRNSLILDDTYNAAPEAMHMALDTLRDLPAKRKIAVLGDMLEIGGFTEQAHREIGMKAAKFCDIIFTVGDRAKFIADEARKISQNCEIKSFDNPVEVGKSLGPVIQEGDLILVKGSQGMRMEKTIEEIMAEPEKAKKLLVRQDNFWQNTPFSKV